VEIRAASWDDVAALLDRRAAAGAAVALLPRVRDEWGRDGRDAWAAEGGGVAVLTAAGELLVATGDAGAAAELVDAAAARGRQRGLAAIHIRTASEDDPTRALADRRGLAIERDVLCMWRRLDGDEPEPSLPAGVRVRTFDPADAETVHELLDTEYASWDRSYVPMPHDEWVEFMLGDDDFDATVWWLAEADDALAGCALHWRSGWVKDVAVRESERGRGIAGSLLRLGFAEFARRGVSRVGLKVDAANPTGAISLYERLGFVTERREQMRLLVL
jgi:ribosomal protein S18 acetylase RimI-like enzyme